GSRREHSLKHLFTPRGDAVLAALDGIAAETGATPAQVALAWIFATPGLTGALASATSVAQVESLIPAMELALDAEQMRRLNEAAATPSCIGTAAPAGSSPHERKGRQPPFALVDRQRPSCRGRGALDAFGALAARAAEPDRFRRTREIDAPRERQAVGM